MKWICLRKQQQIIYELIDYCSLILANVVKAFEESEVSSLSSLNYSIN